MAKGKYAEKARNAREAEVRYASALQETNRLRAHVHRLRKAEEENVLLRRRIAFLETELEAGTSEKVRKQEQSLRKWKADWNRAESVYRGHYRQLLDRATDAILTLITEELDAGLKTPRGKRLLALYMAPLVDFVDDESREAYAGSTADRDLAIKQFQAAMTGYSGTMPVQQPRRGRKFGG